MLMVWMRGSSLVKGLELRCSLKEGEKKDGVSFAKVGVLGG